MYHKGLWSSNKSFIQIVLSLLASLADRFSMDNKANINYDALKEGRSAILNNELQSALNQKSRGRVSNLRRSVLDAVKDGRYDNAKNQLSIWLEMQLEYPRFKNRADRYEKHCMDLISTVDFKRNMDGLSSLSVAKQREIHESVIGHFENLKQQLKKLEQLEREVRLEDMRSTAMVMRTLAYAVGVIVAIYFVVDFSPKFVLDLANIIDAVVTNRVNSY